MEITCLPETPTFAIRLARIVPPVLLAHASHPLHNGHHVDRVAIGSQLRHMGRGLALDVLDVNSGHRIIHNEREEIMRMMKMKDDGR